jgi:hypothetical protein
VPWAEDDRAAVVVADVGLLVGCDVAGGHDTQGLMAHEPLTSSLCFNDRLVCGSVFTGSVLWLAHWSRPQRVAPHTGPRAQRRAWQQDAATHTSGRSSGRSRGLGDASCGPSGCDINERDGAVVVGASVPEAVVAVWLWD